MKTITVMLIVALVFFLRVNLPSNDINNTILLQSNSSLYEEFAAKVVTSQVVAEWQIIDFIIFKIACSERLKIRLIALPLNKWEIHKKDIKSCKLSELI